MRFQKQTAALTAEKQLRKFLNTKRGSLYWGLTQDLHYRGYSIRQIVGYLTGTGIIQTRT